jgi:hypothetical protein
MAIQTFNPWLPPYELLVARSTTVHDSVTIDASGEKFVFVFRAPKTGNLSKATFCISSVITAEDLKVSWQDVDGTTGNPDGTVDQYRVFAKAGITAATLIQTGIISSDGTDGGSKRAVTIGDWVACVIEFNSAIGSVTFSMPGIASTYSGAKNSAYAANNTTGSFVKSNTGQP